MLAAVLSNDLLKPRWAINRVGAIGLPFVIIGGGLSVLAGMFADSPDIWVLWLLGGLFSGFGLVWMLWSGRYGGMGDSKRLLATGQRCLARVIERTMTGTTTSTTTTGGHAHQSTGSVYRIDLELREVNKKVRLFRYVSNERAGSLFLAKELDVAFDPANPRRIAIDWDRVPTPAEYHQRIVAEAQQQSQAQMAQAQAHAAQLQAPTQGKVLTAQQIATGSHGEPVLQLVVELPGSGAPTYVRGTVAGPAGRTVQVGEMVQVQLDATRSTVVSVHW